MIHQLTFLSKIFEVGGKTFDTASHDHPADWGFGEECEEAKGRDKKNEEGGNG